MKRRRALLFTLTFVLALCAACGLWLHRERRQYALNRQLIDALRHKDTHTAIALINTGADPNTRFEPTPTPTLPQLLNQLLHHTPPPTNDSPIAFQIACGGYCFIETVISGFVTLKENLPLVQAILAHGANVHAKAADGSTALHLAVAADRLHTVELLLQHGADANVQDEAGNTPLMLVSHNNTANVAHLLLAHGANPNVTDINGRTAMYYALFSPNAKSLIPLLLAHGVNPNLRNKSGVTPLQWAQSLGRPDLMRLLTRDAK